MAFKINPAFWAPILGVVYRLWNATLSYRIENRERLQEARAQGHHLAFALWHDELFPGVEAARGMNLVIVVSQSQDGELLARVLEGLGFATARGSSRRGGLHALREARRLMRERHADVVLTVDGPKGPRHEIKDGIIYLACRTPALIVPVRAFLSRAKVFERSWDRFQLPLPWSHCRVVFGAPYAVAATELNAETLASEKKRLAEQLESLGAAEQPGQGNPPA